MAYAVCILFLKPLQTNLQQSSQTMNVNWQNNASHMKVQVQAPSLPYERIHVSKMQVHHPDSNQHPSFIIWGKEKDENMKIKGADKLSGGRIEKISYFTILNLIYSTTRHSNSNIQIISLKLSRTSTNIKKPWSQHYTLIVKREKSNKPWHH